jgi:formylglycine-generating enzyme required for sulfatase activity
MSESSEHITDKELSRLLKQQLLKDGPLTQKLIDMEAAFVFGSEAVITPSAQKEQQLISRLKRSGKWKMWLKWLLPVMIIGIAAIILFIYNDKKDVSEASFQGSQTMLNKSDNDILLTTALESKNQNDEAGTTGVVQHQTIIPGAADSSLNDEVNGLNEVNSGNMVLAGNTKLEKAGDNNNDYANIPVLSKEQIDETNKYKAKMVKQLIKKDKDNWALIPMSTEIYKGDTFSIQSFYISTTEVTNKQYRTFLHDLLIQEHFDDYLKAVPDTLQWIKGLPDAQSAAYAESMTNMYFWHPAYDNYPVVNISREGAQMYCIWLTKAANEKVMKDYPRSKWESLLSNDMRIPVELEWVTAARGGIKNGAYPWGGPDVQNAKGCYLANFNIKKSEGKLKPQRECDIKYPNAFTSAGTILGEGWSAAFVNSYNPNYYGVYCMSGNVAEMVWVRNEKDGPASGSISLGEPGTKGGSWNSDSDHLKIEAEDEFSGVTEGQPFIGFRPVMTYMARVPVK